MVGRTELVVLGVGVDDVGVVERAAEAGSSDGLPWVSLADDAAGPAPVVEGIGVEAGAVTSLLATTAKLCDALG
ncbi:hypothetical protein UVI_02046630 [Ustilaginoidea virens]|uniref:Uncharacterized protein n=1 Tax=Ustilaginoidea virens TaxID=1159556 RepID=A0A1B5L331_USTVR|nr:hypothetical protein UVI_02046630 [Ustilaginoidea virens]